MPTTRVYVGDLGDRGDRMEIQREFERYGRIKETWVARNPPGFAFVFFESHREAEDAVRAIDGAMLCGVRVRVEIAKGPDKSDKSRYGPKCMECGRVGHSSRECTRRPGYVFRGKNSDHHRVGSSRRRDRSRSRDLDRRPRRRSHSRSPPQRRRKDSRPSHDRPRSRSRSVEKKRRSNSQDSRDGKRVYSDDYM